MSFSDPNTTTDDDPEISVPLLKYTSSMLSASHFDFDFIFMRIT